MRLDQVPSTWQGRQDRLRILRQRKEFVLFGGLLASIVPALALLIVGGRLHDERVGIAGIIWLVAGAGAFHVWLQILDFEIQRLVDYDSDDEEDDW